MAGSAIKEQILKRNIIVLLGSVCVIAAAMACGSTTSDKTPTSKSATTSTSGASTTTSSGKKLKVVTTVAPLTNIVLNVGGDRIDLEGIIPEASTPIRSNRVRRTR